MSIKSTDDTLSRLSSITIDHDTFKNMKEIDKNDKLSNKKNYLYQSLTSYEPINNHQSPIEQQDFRSRQTLISILIALLFFTGMTIIMYQILKYFIHENISKRIKPNCRNANDTCTK